MIVVTGGAGFIGSALIKELNDSGRTDILVVDRFRDGLKWKNLRGLKFERFIHADSLFTKESKRYLDTATVIFHMGACSSTTEMNMDYLMENNVEYSKKLFTFARSKEVPFIYASSAATYGDGALGYSDNHEGISSLSALNPYGYSKQLFDEWVLAEYRKPTIWFGLKFFNVYGPQEYHKEGMRSVVHQAFEQIKSGGIVKLFESYKDGVDDGDQLRDFVYVKDLTRAMLRMSEESDNMVSGIYNMGTGKARSFNDLVKASFSAMNKDTNIEYVPMPKHLKGQYQYYTQADMNKFDKLFPDFTFVSLEDGVKDYIQSHLDTENCYF